MTGGEKLEVKKANRLACVEKSNEHRRDGRGTVRCDDDVRSRDLNK